jgi:hypothetical protein
MLRTAIALFLLLTSPLAAQSLSFGEPVALTNTRYGTVASNMPQLATNGQDFFLFWQGGSTIRVTKIVDGERRVGRTVIEDATQNFHAIWTGTHFLVAAQTRHGWISGRLLEANGEAAGPTFTIVAGGQGPRLAAGNQGILLLYQKGETFLATARLTRQGALVAGSERELTTDPVYGGHDYDVAGNGTGFAAALATFDGVTIWTFDGAGRELTEQRIGLVPSPDHTLALASNGADYALVYGDSTSWPRAVLLRPDGSRGAPLTLDTATAEPVGTQHLSLTWTGTTWAAAYRGPQPSHGTIRVTHFDAPVQRNLGSEQVNGRVTTSSIAAAPGRVLVSWLDQRDSVARVTALPLAQPALVTYGAGTQVLLGSTSSNDSTLVVWRESVEGRLTLRAGVRNHDGHWLEREITDEQVPDSLIVRSDGHGFVLISQQRIWGLDDRGRVDWTNALYPIRVTDAVWNGQEYVVTTFENDDVLATRTLSTSGVFGNPVPAVVNRRATSADLAFDGARYLVVWTEQLDCPILCIPYGTVRGTRLDANRQPAGDVDFGAPAASELQAIWDGRHYVVAWGPGQMGGARVPAFSNGAPEPFSIAGGLTASQLHMERVAGGAALVWAEHVNTTTSLQSRRIAFLPYGSNTPVRFTRDAGVALTGELRVEPLPNAGFAFLQSIVQPDAPHHGATRVTMTAIAPLLPQLPDAPRINAAADFGRLRIEWTASSSPSLDGYRLEYRIGDGSWNEIEQWFDADERGIILPWSLRQGVPYYFRVRAIDESGASSYSKVAGANLPRRRAVR